MKQRPRIYYSDSQKALMWERWKQGWTLHEIGKLFDRAQTSIRRILAETGGFRPAQRLRASSVLTLAEGEEISRAMVAGESIRSTAARLARSLHDNLIVGSRACHGNPYDGRTPHEQLGAGHDPDAGKRGRTVKRVRRSGLPGCGCRQPECAHRVPGQDQAHQRTRKKATPVAPGHRADHWPPQGRSPHEPLPPLGRAGRPSALGAVRGGLQPALAAAHDCQEGGGLLVGALFAPAQGGGHDLKLAARAARTPQQRVHRVSAATDGGLK